MSINGNSTADISGLRARVHSHRGGHEQDGNYRGRRHAQAREQLGATLTCYLLRMLKGSFEYDRRHGRLRAELSTPRTRTTGDRRDAMAHSTGEMAPRAARFRKLCHDPGAQYALEFEAAPLARDQRAAERSGAGQFDDALKRSCLHKDWWPLVPRPSPSWDNSATTTLTFQDTAPRPSHRISLWTKSASRRNRSAVIRRSRRAATVAVGAR